MNTFGDRLTVWVVGKGEEFEANLDLTHTDVLSIRVERTPAGHKVIDVQPGVVQAWNEANPSRQIVKGCVIVAANGKPVSADPGRKLSSYVYNGRLCLRV